MQARSLIAAILFFSGHQVSAEPEIEFSGVLVTGGHTQVALTGKATHVTRWVEIGGHFSDFTVAAYDSKEGVVVLEKGGAKFRFPMISGKILDAAANPPSEKSAAIIGNLRRILAAANRFYLENARTSVRLAELVGPGRAIEELQPVAGESYDALPLTVSSRKFSVTTADGLVVSWEPTDPPPVLRECIVRPGDTFAKIARESGLTIAQLLELNAGARPELIRIGQKLRLK